MQDVNNKETVYVWGVKERIIWELCPFCSIDKNNLLIKKEKDNNKICSFTKLIANGMNIEPINVYLMDILINFGTFNFPLPLEAVFYI